MLSSTSPLGARLGCSTTYVPYSYMPNAILADSTRETMNLHCSTLFKGRMVTTKGYNISERFNLNVGHDSRDAALGSFTQVLLKTCPSTLESFYPQEVNE